MNQFLLKVVEVIFIDSCVKRVKSVFSPLQSKHFKNSFLVFMRNISCNANSEALPKLGNRSTDTLQFSDIF